MKTTPTTQSVTEFINGVEDDQKRSDCLALAELMTEATGCEPTMWGPSIIGFGSYHYKYESGREGDWFITGFSPRKANLTVYIMQGFGDYEALLDKIGKHKTGKSCLYLKSLANIDMAALRTLIVRSVEYIRETYPT
ncbi:MAG: DUF1801 domain-containing protein [Myxococcales bacterium]|nr:DUF1801 domain-containing protein [Myxococcales bacterium]